VAILLYWAWRTFFPDPVQVIRHRLAEVSRLASFSSSEGPLAKVANANKLANSFTGNIEVELAVTGYQPFSLHGRDELLRQALAARSALASLRVDFPGVGIRIAPDNRSAVVAVTARVRTSAQAEPDFCELQFTMKKLGGDWLISRLATVKVLN
jgi:hypothetical protein